MRHYYIFAYDIGDPKRQARVRRLLQGYATGAQKSLFECWLTHDELGHLCRQIAPIIENTDSFHFFRLPETENSVLFGMAKPLRYDYFVVA